jgi:hypothetical protein
MASHEEQVSVISKVTRVSLFQSDSQQQEGTI